MTVNALLCKAPLIVVLALPWPRAGPPAAAAVVMTLSEQPAPGHDIAMPGQPMAMPVRPVPQRSPEPMVLFSGGWLSAPDARSLSAADAQAAQWLAAISNGPPDVREQLATDLGQHRNTAAIGPLARALADSDPGVRRAAIESLSRIGGADAARALAVALRDSNARIREAAVNALGDIGGPTSRELLRQAQRDVSSFVRHAADETLETLAAGTCQEQMICPLLSK